MKRALLALAVVALAATGCSSPPSKGVVYDKNRFPPYEDILMICVAYGRYGCTFWTTEPIWHPAEWQLCLRDKDKTGCRDVDEATYWRFGIGDYYQVGAS